MKKAAATTILLLICIAVSWASVSDVRVASMGNTYVAYDKLCINPAFLYFRTEKTGIYSTVLTSEDIGEHTYPYTPGLCLQGVVFAGNISLELKSDFSYTRTAETASGMTFDIENSIELGVSAAAGVGHFSAGISVEGGSVRANDGVQASIGRIVVDIFEQSVISTLPRMAGSEFIKVRGGLGAKFDNFSAGLVLDDIIDHNNDKWAVTLESLVSHIDVGFSFTTGEYGGRGHLNELCLTVAFQVNDLFTNNTAYALGTDIMWQILQEYSASLRLGYEGSFLNKEDGSMSAGLGLRVGRFDFAASVCGKMDGLTGEDPFGLGCSVAIGYSK